MSGKHFSGSYSSINVPFEEEHHLLESIYVRSAIGLLYTIIFLLCFFGNLAVVLVVSLHRKRRSVSKFCLGNMAVVNLAVSIFCILQNLTVYLLDDWIFGELMCKMYHFVTNLSHAASMLILVVVSVERYIVLLHPSRCRRIRTTQALMFVILSVWLMSAGFSLPSLLYFHTIQIQLNEKGDFGVICAPSKSVYNSATSDTIYFILLYVVPLVVVLFLYLRIGLFLRQDGRLRRGLQKQTARIVENGPIRGVPSASQNVGQESRLPGELSFDPVFTFRGQVHPHKFRNDLLCGNTKGTMKWKSYPTYLLRFVSTVHSEAHSDGPVRGPSTEHSMMTWGSDNTGAFVNPQKKLIRSTDGTYQITRNASSAFEQDTNRVISPLSILPGRTQFKPEDPKNLNRYNRRQLSHIRCKHSQKIGRMFIFIVLTFAVFNLPFHARKLCLNYCPSFDVASDATNFIASLTWVLMFANCAVNPLLYAFMSKYFRASLSNFCRRRWSKSKRNDAI